MAWKICLSDIDLGADEVDRVSEVLRSKWLSMGEVTKEFESRFAEFLGVKHAFLVCNGTAALHLANLAVGVGPGDEVIVPSLTFVASANASVYCGGVPVFADIVGPNDLNVSPNDIRAKVNSKTKAITVVHYGGYAADMDAIMAIARERNVAVIEDAAHAPGASLNGRMLGTIGDVGCFSFFSNKNLVTGEGGAVVTNDDDRAEAIRLMRSHGMTSLSYDRHKGHAFSYDVVRLGYNYRATEITAALALVQLEKLSRMNARRSECTELYRERLREIDGISVPFAGHRGVSSCHLMSILLHQEADRGVLMKEVRDEGIQTSIHYPPIHLFQAYLNSPRRELLDKTEGIARQQLSLPLHGLMTADNVADVCSALRVAHARSIGDVGLESRGA